VKNYVIAGEMSKYEPSFYRYGWCDS